MLIGSFSKKALYILFAYLILVLPAQAAEDFIIEDIRVEGLQRLTPGTVFNYLPMKVGDEFNDQRSGEVARVLFKTGLFDDVRLKRDGNVLVVIVKERPSIASITLNGNEDIKSDDLIDSLRQIGFAEGRVFDKSQLDGLERELRRQYFSLGKYAVRIKSTVTELENNRVDVVIDISEGLPAKIRQINIVGNESFDEDDLLKQFKLSTPTLFSFFTKVDQYSKQKLSADLESLRSFYLDNGYVNFNIDSTQVSITPDKKDIYITVNVTEGEPFTVSRVELAGDLIIPEEDLFKQVRITRGDLFSRKAVTETTTNLTDIIGNEGYAFANVNAIPDIDRENKTVAVTFFIDPGKRVYVRRINFSGNVKTRDEVLRREMRQLEGAWISTTKVQRGRIRLQRLGYFQEVNVETPAVPGESDQVDVNYSVVENPSGQFLAGLGFSQSQGFIFQTSVTQDNFLGSGKSIAFAFNNSEVNRQFTLGYRNPYYTIDGISRGFNATFQQRDASNANVTRFDSTVWGGGVDFGIPVSEFNSFFLSLNYENTEIDTDSIIAREVIDFINLNGDRFDILRLNSSFTYDTRNSAFFSDDGMLHRFSAQVAVPGPGDSLEFYKLSYRTQIFYELIEDYVFSFKGDIGYGDSYGDTEEFPFFENFYAGGPKSVRGYEENTLGPKDSTGRPLGGNLRLIAGAEVILPVPFLRDLKSFRISGFFDAGNVYGVDEDFDVGELRYSAGIAGIWVSPFGLLSASVAAPIGDKDGDETQPFQFTFGTNF
jgi:outer membrane protein insertion porin family